MSKLPEKVQRDQPASAATVNAILDYLKEVTIQPGPGYSIAARNVGGTVLALDSSSVIDASIGCGFTPVTWYDDDAGDWMVDFAPAFLLDVRAGEAKAFELGGTDIAAAASAVVADADEYWAKWVTDENGELTAEPVFIKTSSETAVEFAEALASSGTTGEYWVKVCTFTLADGFMGWEMHWCGNIEWYPRPWANVGTGAELLKEFNATYKLRSLKAKDADPGTAETSISGSTKIYDVYVLPEESGDNLDLSGKVEIPSISPQPFDIYDNGDNTVTIGEGFVNGYYLTFSGFSDDFDGVIEGPTDIVKGPAYSYAGTSSQGITSGTTQYIYALVSRNGPGSIYAGNQDVTLPSDAGLEGGQEIFNQDDIDPSGFTAGAPTDAATIATSTLAPDAYTPTSGKAAICLAKATNTSGTIAVIKYVTHNPDIFIPIASGSWSYYTP